MNTTNTITIRIASRPTRHMMEWHDLPPNHGLRDLNLDQFAIADRKWIEKVVEQGSSRVEFEPWDLDDQPVYPTKEEQQTREGWLCYFRRVQEIQHLLKEREKLQVLERQQVLMAELEGLDALSDQELLEACTELDDVRAHPPVTLNRDLSDRLTRLEARVRQLTETRLRERDQHNRTWVQTHGSPALQEAVQQFSGFFVAHLNELDFYNWVIGEHELRCCAEPYRSYVRERIALEFPGAVFSPYLVWKAHPNPTPEEVSQAQDLGGELVWLNRYPDPLDPEDVQEQMLAALFEGPVSAVRVPFELGHVVHFLQGQPRLEPELHHVLVGFHLPKYSPCEVVIGFDLQNLLGQVKQGQLEQLFHLGTRAFKGQLLAVSLLLETTLEGEVLQGHYRVAYQKNGKTIVQVTAAQSWEALQNPHQVVHARGQLVG